MKVKQPGQTFMQSFQIYEAQWVLMCAVVCEEARKKGFFFPLVDSAHVFSVSAQKLVVYV